jgi:hypothetical protein
LSATLAADLGVAEPGSWPEPQTRLLHGRVSGLPFERQLLSFIEPRNAKTLQVLWTRKRRRADGFFHGSFLFALRPPATPLQILPLHYSNSSPNPSLVLHRLCGPHAAGACEIDRSGRRRFTECDLGVDPFVYRAIYRDTGPRVFRRATGPPSFLLCRVRRGRSFPTRAHSYRASRALAAHWRVVHRIVGMVSGSRAFHDKLVVGAGPVLLSIFHALRVFPSTSSHPAHYQDCEWAEAAATRSL